MQVFDYRAYTVHRVEGCNGNGDPTVMYEVRDGLGVAVASNVNQCHSENRALELGNKLNGYKCFYYPINKEIDVYSDNLYHAQCIAAQVLRVPKSKQSLISVYLCEQADGTPVRHSTCEFP